jgi:hypothetical protein
MTSARLTSAKPEKLVELLRQEIGHVEDVIDPLESPRNVSMAER